jgi:hypothetical protein
MFVRSNAQLPVGEPIEVNLCCSTLSVQFAVRARVLRVMPTDTASVSEFGMAFAFEPLTAENEAHLSALVTRHARDEELRAAQQEIARLRLQIRGLCIEHEAHPDALAAAKLENESLRQQVQALTIELANVRQSQSQDEVTWMPPEQERGAATSGADEPSTRLAQFALSAVDVGAATEDRTINQLQGLLRQVTSQLELEPPRPLPGTTASSMEDSLFLALEAVFIEPPRN